MYLSVNWDTLVPAPGNISCAACPVLILQLNTIQLYKFHDTELDTE